MKYVMFTHVKTGIRCPVFFPDIVTHSQLSLGAEWVATSAGQFNFLTQKVSGESSSLLLNPQPGDEVICQETASEWFAATSALQDTSANLSFLRSVQLAKATREAGGDFAKAPWCVWWIDHDNSRRHENFKTFQDADEFYRELRETASEWFQAYIANIKDLPWHPNHPR